MADSSDPGDSQALPPWMIATDGDHTFVTHNTYPEFSGELIAEEERGPVGEWHETDEWELPTTQGFVLRNIIWHDEPHGSSLDSVVDSMDIAIERWLKKPR